MLIWLGVGLAVVGGLVFAASTVLGSLADTAASRPKPGVNAIETTTSPTPTPSHAPTAAGTTSPNIASGPQSNNGSESAPDAGYVVPVPPTLTSITPADGTSAGCASASGTMSVTVSWVANGATAVWVGLNTNNAQQHPTVASAPATGSATVNLDCARDSNVIALTLEGAGGTTNYAVSYPR